MSGTDVANRIAVLGLWAIHIAERSGDAATQLLQRGIKPPVGSGNPVEVFTACGVAAAQELLNTLMPTGVKMRMTIEFDQPHFNLMAKWENDSGDRRVLTVHAPEQGVFLTICQGTPHMARAIHSHTLADAMRAHYTLIAMVRAGQL